MKSVFRAAASLVVFSALSIAASPAEAACTSGQPVVNECALDLVTGPVLASGRVISLGGAYSGIGNGLDGYSANAAAPAVRDAYSYKWFDFDIDASITFPGAFSKVDLENRGSVGDYRYNDYVFLTLGANVQIGAWGFGFVSDLQNFNLTPNAQKGEPSFNALVSRSHILVARQFFDGDFVVGLGARIVGFSISQSTGTFSSTNIVSLSGAGPEFGFLLRPSNQPFRIGATFRSATHNSDPAPDDAKTAAGLVIPDHANLPWELDLGGAIQIGPRPLNDPWLNPHDEEAEIRKEILQARARRAREKGEILSGTPADQRDAKEKELDENEDRERKDEDADLAAFDHEFIALRKAHYRGLPREYLLVSLALLVTGPTANGISLGSFFDQTVARSGALTTFSPRAGLESELWPNHVKLRIGTYIEPSRFGTEPDAKAFRQHFTAGFDLYAFEWTVFGLFDEGTAWRLTGTLDVAPRYDNWGISIGNWH